MPGLNGKNARPPSGKPRFNNSLLVVAALLAAVVAGGSLVSYGISQMRTGEQRQTEQELARQVEADQRKAQQQAQLLAQQNQSTTQASQEATIAESQAVSASIASLKALRVELGDTIGALKDKAKSSASARRTWGQQWARRQATYRSRSATVRAHNARERQHYLAGRVERANSSGKLVIRYTYRPRYWSLPGKPGKPAPLKASAAAEIKRLTTLQGQIDSLTSPVPSQSASAQAFAQVYQALADTTQALGTTVDAASKMARGVVTKVNEGKIVDATKISKVKLSTLDASFDALDQSFSSAMASAGLDAAQVTTDGAVTP